MADVIDTMYCEVVFSLDGGDTGFLSVFFLCVRDDSRSCFFLFVGVPVKGQRFALFLWMCCFMLEGIVDAMMRHR